MILHVVRFVFVLAVLGLLYAVSGNRAPRIPDDELHAIFDDVQLCRECHNPEGVAPLIEEHPPKDQCLKCHTVKESRRRAAEKK